MQVAVATNEAFAKVLRWRAGQSSALGLVARQAVAEAVAAESVRQSFPVAARELEQPWWTAVDVRARLRVLGPEAEEVALRMLPAWRLPLEDLLAVASVLTERSRPAARVVPDPPPPPAGTSQRCLSRLSSVRAATSPTSQDVADGRRTGPDHPRHRRPHHAHAGTSIVHGPPRLPSLACRMSRAGARRGRPR